MTKIYTATFGELRVDTLINKTRQGYRVKSSSGFEQVVAMKKQYSGWDYFRGDKIYHQQIACETLAGAKEAASAQLKAFESGIQSQQDRLNKKTIDAMNFKG